MVYLSHFAHLAPGNPISQMSSQATLTADPAALNDAERGTMDREAPSLFLDPSKSSPSFYGTVISRPPSTLALNEKKYTNSPSYPVFSKELTVIPKGSPPRPLPKVSVWVSFQLWFNTYRYEHPTFAKLLCTDFANRKFFTFILTLNLIGVLLAALNKWEYPRRYTGALVLGNLQVAILMRNELFGRILYLIINTLFAKVRDNVLCAGFDTDLMSLSGPLYGGG